MPLHVDAITGRVRPASDGDDDDGDSGSDALSASQDDEQNGMVPDALDDDALDDLGDENTAAYGSALDVLSVTADGAQPRSRRGRFNVQQFFNRRRPKHHRAAQAATGATIDVNDAIVRARQPRLTPRLQFTPARFVKPRNVASYVACPPPLTHATMVYAAAPPEAKGGALVLFGGMETSGVATSATWIFHESTNQWEQVVVPTGHPHPAARCGHCAVILKDAPPIVGLNASPRRTTQRVLLNAAASEAAEELYNPTMVVLCGADLAMGKRFNDVWAFNIREKTWRCVHPGGCDYEPGAALPPEPRWGAVAAVCDDRVVVYGGESATYSVLGDHHVFDCGEGSWRKLRRAVAPIPTPRVHAAGCTVGEKLVVTGGVAQGTDAIVDHTWVLELRTLLWRPIATPPPPPSQQPPTLSPMAYGSLRGAGAGGGGGGAAAAGAESPYSDIPGQNLTGHALLPFDDLALLVGGLTAAPGSGASAAPSCGAWVLDVPNEQWMRLGALPTTAAAMLVGDRSRRRAARGESADAASSPSPSNAAGDAAVVEGTESWPAPVAFGCIAARSEYSVTSGIDSSLSLEALAACGIHLTDERETGQYVDALHAALEQHASFAGILVVRNGRPVLVRNSTCFLFGGTAGLLGRPSNNMYVVELDPRLDADESGGGAAAPSHTPS